MGGGEELPLCARFTSDSANSLPTFDTTCNPRGSQTSEGEVPKGKVRPLPTTQHPWWVRWDWLRDNIGCASHGSSR